MINIKRGYLSHVRLRLYLILMDVAETWTVIGEFVENCEITCKMEQWKRILRDESNVFEVKQKKNKDFVTRCENLHLYNFYLQRTLRDRNFELHNFFLCCQEIKHLGTIVSYCWLENKRGIIIIRYCTYSNSTHSPLTSSRLSYPPSPAVVYLSATRCNPSLVIRIVMEKSEWMGIQDKSAKAHYNSDLSLLWARKGLLQLCKDEET